MKKLLNLTLFLATAAVVQPVLAQDSTRAAKVSDTSRKRTYGPVKLFAGANQFAVWSIGVNAGGMSPVVAWGGLNQFSKNKIDLGYGAFLKYQINHSFGFRLDYAGGKLSATNDPSSQNASSSYPRRVPAADTKVTYMASLKGEVDVASINFLKRRSGLRLFLTGGYGLAGYKPTLYGSKSIKSGFVPLGAGIKFKAGEALAFNIGYDAYLFDGANLLGAPGVTGNSRQSKSSFGYAGVEWTFGAGVLKPALVWNNPIGTLYDELKNNDSLSKEINGVKTRVTSVEGDVSNLKKDSDGDGVSDVFDKCPNTPAGNKVDGSGCDLPKPEVVAPPVVKISDEEITVVRAAFRNLNFVTGKATILPSSFPSLDRLSEILNNKANLSLTLKGFTDNVGKAAANLKLSKDRAESVKTYLVSKGVTDTRITAQGYGKARPVASNKTKTGRAKNRRVEMNLF